MPLVILLFGLVITSLVFLLVRGWEESHNLDEIAFRSETRLIAVKDNLHAMLESAEHIRAFVRNELVVEDNDELTLHEFREGVKNILSSDEKRGMQVMAWLPNVPHSQHEMFSEQLRNETGKEIEITNHSGEAAKPASHEDAHYPLYFVVFNATTNLKIGFDLASKPSYREHMRLARESRGVLIDIGADDSSHQVISIFLPLFDQKKIDQSESSKLIGYIFSQWDVGEIMEYAIGELPVSGIDYYLNDEKGVNIYTHQSRSRSANEFAERSDTVWQGPFNIAEHYWSLSAAPAPFFTRGHPIILAFGVLLFGFVLSFGSAFYVFRVSIRKEQIERQVELRTKELIDSQNTLQETQRIARLGGWEWDVINGTLKWSDEVYRLFGYEPQAFEASFDQLNEAVHPDDRERLSAAVEKALKGEEYSIVHRIILPDGVVRSVHEQGQVEYDENNQPIRMIGTVQDITEQRRAERRLHRLAMALAETAESVVITNREGIIRYVNHAFEKMSGYSADEVLGKTPGLVKSGQHPDEYYDVMWKQVTHGKSWAGTFTNKSKSGELYEVEQTISPIHDQQGNITGYVAVQRDVTGEREHRAKMEHTQRLESLGVLAGGIAHDFNNLLTSIIGNASLARTKKNCSESRIHLDRIVKASERAAELCKQMLAYSGQGNYLNESFDLNDRIHDMTELLLVSLSKRVRLKLTLDSHVCVIHGDKSQIQQVIMNLVINASEAIEEANRDGEILFTTHTVEMTEEDLNNCLHHETEKPKPGTYCCITVSDNGCGMDDETRLKVFDPFFTTKFTGRGLGTSAILGIVQSHQGLLEMETEVGVGTTFRVYFPSEEEQKPLEKATEQESIQVDDRALKGKMILLIDDEAAILETAGLMLEDVGCEVKCAATASLGIKLYKEHADEISMIILDMTMPEMDGLSCAIKLFEINPGALIVLSSGYSREILEERIGELNISACLQKPYSQNELVNLVRETLNNS